MTRRLVIAANSVTLVVALGAASTIGALRAGQITASTEAREGPTPDAVADADGVDVPIAAYERIVSMTPVVDAILLETIPRHRILGVSGTMRAALGDHRFAGIRHVDGARLEEIVSLRPDLVFVSGLADASQVERLRAADVRVYRAASMRGVLTFSDDILRVSAVVDAADAGRLLQRRFLTRLGAVAADIDEDARPRALYLGVMGNGLYGGGRETSYDDVLRAAGLVNVAANTTGWPAFEPEAVLAMDPDVMVLHEGSRRALCERPGLAALRTCRGAPGTHVVELPSNLLNDPGLGMLPCAERLRAAVHGAPPGLEAAPPGDAGDHTP